MKSNIYRKMMVATDGSELAKKAVDTAIKISKMSEAKLYAVYVISYEGISTVYPKEAGWEKAALDYFRIEGKEATAYAENSGRTENVEVESIILDGNPAREIVDFAEKNDIDLIVMGTLGKTGLNRFLLGSVAENVVKNSKKAVLIVKGENAEKGE
jgi:nucleotide-binding universal stress UspA family protein